MTEFTFREMYTLTDAIELLGHYLFAHTWTGQEHSQQEVMSPDELASLRTPLEKQREEILAEISEIEKEIGRSLSARAIASLKKRRGELQKRRGNLNVQLNVRLLPLNDFTRANYESFTRYERARETLITAIRERRLTAHNGRGHEINSLVWTGDKRFRLHLELSIVVNSRTAGSPRWQPARIDKPVFERWLATIERHVEPLTDPSARDRLREFFKMHVRQAEHGDRKSKTELFAVARAELPGVTKRMFEQVWADETPASWHKPGAPKGRKLSRSR